MSGFLLNGIIEVRSLATIPAAPLAPTQAELAAGTSLVGTEQTEELIGINGWTKTTEAVATGGYASLNVGALAGPSSYPQSSLTWRSDNISEVIFSAVAATTTTSWLYISQMGHASGNRSYGFPVTISSREEGLERGVAQSFQATYSVTPPYEATQAA